MDNFSATHSNTAELNFSVIEQKAKITRVKTIKKGHDRDNSTWVLERLHPNRSLFQLRYLF